MLVTSIRTTPEYKPFKTLTNLFLPLLHESPPFVLRRRCFQIVISHFRQPSIVVEFWEVFEEIAR